MSIINITYNKKSELINTNYVADKFTLPDKIFGSLNKKAIRVWNDYVYNNSSTGVLLTGDQGTGKSLVGMIISNIAIANGLMVYTLNGSMNNISDGIGSIINYLDSLNNCVIFIDEFGKLFRNDVQNNFLTMLSDFNNSKKIFILTENYLYNINSFILNRPGRVKYHFDFVKIDQDLLIEYCHYRFLSIEKTNELESLLLRASAFSYDELKAIVDEWIKYPNDSLEQVLSVLNVSRLRTPATYELISVIDKETGKDIRFTPQSGLSKSDLGCDRGSIDSYYNRSHASGFTVYLHNNDISDSNKKVHRGSGSISLFDIGQSNTNGDDSENYRAVTFYFDSIKCSVNKDTIRITSPNYILEWKEMRR